MIRIIAIILGSVLGMLVVATTAHPALAMNAKAKVNDQPVTKKVETEDTTRMFSDHLKYIEKKLAVAVKKGELTSEQKKMIMVKLRRMMNKGPSAEEYRKMNESELKSKINSWKKRMGSWAKENGLTLAQIREMTGKGNKYLMGVEID